MDYRFHMIRIKITTAYFAEIDKLILILTWNHKGPRIVKMILEKMKKVEGQPDFKIYYYKAMVIKTA